MARAPLTQEEHEAEVRALLLAVATLLADDRVARIASEPTAERTEVLLSHAGLSAAHIGAIVGKQPGAVRMAISRARKKTGDAANADGPV
jgi:DNA-directed RNA polymerase specialized sigma24 family protein